MYSSRILPSACIVQISTVLFCEQINLSCVRFIILDEADRMLDLGFKGSIQELMDNPNIPPKSERQTLMFSATFPPEIQELAGQLLKDYLFIVVGVIGNANTDIEQTIVQVDQFSKRDQLLSILNNSGTVFSCKFHHLMKLKNIKAFISVPCQGIFFILCHIILYILYNNITCSCFCPLQIYC